MREPVQCLDGKTDILTRRGWLTNQQLEVSDQALAPADSELRLISDVKHWLTSRPQALGDVAARTGNGDPLLASAK